LCVYVYIREINIEKNLKGNLIKTGIDELSGGGFKIFSPKTFIDMNLSNIAF
jgi:hypothetical protein